MSARHLAPIHTACDCYCRMLNLLLLTPNLTFGEPSLTDQKSDESFKIVDRRLFNAEGELRQEAVEQERRDSETAAATAAAAKAAAPPAPEQFRAKPGPGIAALGTEGPGLPVESIGPSRGFQMLVDFLARNAAAVLGGMADPRTGKAFVDLEGARDLIDMLDALREKTEGNLAADDEQLLVEILGSLKLTFMEVSRAAAGAAMGEKAKARP
jgi:Domain of unknown function (DUF1844)